MLRFSDSRNFGRTLAAIGLVAGPVLLFVSALVDPAWAEESVEYLQEVADGTGRYLVAGALGSIGSLLFIPGMLGVAKLLRGRRVTFGQIAATLVATGLIGLTAVLAFNGVDVILAEADDREAAAGIFDDFEESAGTLAYFVAFFFIGIVLGSILLAVALFRQRIVPVWSPILLVVAIVLGFIGGTQILNALSFLLLGAALFPLAMRIWSLSDEAWGHWEPLAQGPPAGAAGPTETPGGAPQRSA
jgi:hypothetical protein